MNSVIEGKPDVVRTAITVLLAEGHLLLEDVPGVGKTMLAKTLARSIDCSVRRVQFTPDLLPSDITGVLGVQPGRARLRVPAGRDLRQRRRRRRDQPRLAEDAVARCWSAMEEAQVTVDGTDLHAPPAVHRHGHPEPDRDGGHLPAARGPARPLHGADLDGLPLGPGRARHARHPRRRVAARRPRAGHRRGDDVHRWCRRSARSTPARPSSSTSSTSPTPPARARPCGWAPPREPPCTCCGPPGPTRRSTGRDHVLPDDVQQVAVPVLAHRLIPTGETQMARRTTADVVATCCGASRFPSANR